MGDRSGAPNPAFPLDPIFQARHVPIILWDTSSDEDFTSPNDNGDRIRKLGHKASARGAAVGLFGEKSGRGFLIDGLQKSNIPMSSILPFEPDNWTPRYHDFKGGKAGRDSVWAIRIIADHCKMADQAAHRSTMVMDNGDQSNVQEWAWLSDLFWVVDKTATVSQPDLAYTHAGFLAILADYENDQDDDQSGDRKKMGAQFGHGHRSALALNIARNAGVVTDGFYFGALSHFICFLSNAGTTTGCVRPAVADEVGIRGDTGYKFKSDQIGRWVMKDGIKPKDDKDGEWKLVYLPLLLNDAKKDDNLDVGLDAESNHSIIDKGAKKKEMWGAVRIRKPGKNDTYRYDWSWHNNPPDRPSSSSSSSSGGSVPTTGAGGDHDGQGSETPNSDGSNPDGRPPVATYDKAYVNPDGTRIDETADSGDSPSTQVQSGWAPPQSPGMTVRGNILSKIDGVNPVGTVIATKLKGYSRVRVEMNLTISDVLVGNEVIELNVKIGAHEGGKSPTKFYSQAFNFRPGDTAYPNEHELSFLFSGFNADEEQLLTIYFERRNDTANGVNSAAELVCIRSTAVNEP